MSLTLLHHRSGIGESHVLVTRQVLSFDYKVHGFSLDPYLQVISVLNIIKSCHNIKKV